jgi:ABC-type uncharacterized transport system permease subunit
VPGPWFWAAAAFYALAGVLHLGFLLGLKDRAMRSALAAFVLAFLLHMCEIGARGIAGLHPASSAREALGFVAWLLAGGYLLARIRFRIDAVGAFLAPASLVLLVTARFSPSSGESTAGLGVLGRVHISLATAGVSVFALATALAVVYIVAERQLKHKHLGALVRKGVALETLDTLVHRCVQVGFPIFTVAMVTGAWWSARRAGGMRGEYLIAMVAWAAFAALLVARTTAGWRGRRAALMTIVGFTSALVVLAIYLARAAAGGS